MLLTLRILLAAVALICFLGGANILLKGANYFLPKGTPPQLILDNLVRFLAGVYFGSGFLCVYAALHTATIGDVAYYLGLIVIFAGVGRLYSLYKVGSAGAYFVFVMVLEVLLGAAIMVLEGLL